MRKTNVFWVKNRTLIVAQPLSSSNLGVEPKRLYSRVKHTREKECFKCTRFSRSLVFSLLSSSTPILKSKSEAQNARLRVRVCSKNDIEWKQIYYLLIDVIMCVCVCVSTARKRKTPEASEFCVQSKNINHSIIHIVDEELRQCCFRCFVRVCCEDTHSCK